MNNRCPYEGEHTPSPSGYVAWHEWAERMSKTHRQVECDGCGLLKVWVSKYAICPECEESVSMRRNGHLRKHGNLTLAVCPGSGRATPVGRPES